MKKIETEYKLELSEAEFERCFQLLQAKATFVKTSDLEDFYFKISKFDEKGYNFTRIRVYDKTNYEKTIKTWKLVGDGRVREEQETGTTIEELNSLLAQEPEAISMHKQRSDFQLYLAGFANEAIISLDKLFLNDGLIRYFVEVEIDVPEEDSNSVRPKLKNWLLGFFGLSERAEGIGMFRLALTLFEAK